jgi:hypothetical protein
VPTRRDYISTQSTSIDQAFQVYIGLGQAF